MAVMRPRWRATDLAAERADVDQMKARRSEVEARVMRSERKYRIASEKLHRAISRGEIRETGEVSQWLIDYDLLRRVGKR